MLKKSLSLLLTLCMVLALAPVSAFAAETTSYDAVEIPAKLPKAVNLDGYITQDDGYHAFGIVANNVFTPIAEYSSGNSGKNYVMSDVAEALNDAQTFTYFFAQDDTKYYFGIKLDRKSVNVNGYNYFSSQQDLTFKFGFGSNDKPVTINLPVRNNVSIGTDTYNLKVSDATIKAALVRGVDGSAAKSYFNTEPTYSNPSGLGAGVWSAAMYNNLARVASDNRTIAEGTVIGHSAARAQMVGASVFTYEFSITKASVEAYLGEGSTAPSSIYFSAASTTRYGSMNDLGLTAMAGADSFDSTYSANIQFIDVDADNCEHNYVENPIDSFLVNKSNWVAGNGYYHAIHPTSNTTANSRLRCGQAAEYYKSCSICRTAGTDTFYGKVKEHSFVIRGNIVSSEVTACNAEKPSRITYEYKCAWCDKTAELPLIDYNHNYEVIDGTSKIYSRAYFKCDDCGKEAFRQMCGVTTQTSVHTEKTISIPATCYSPLLTVTYCSNSGQGSASVCAYSATAQTGPTNSHNAVLEKEYDASLTQSGNDKNSTCEAGGVYFKTCDVCGAVDETSETFTTNALGHLDDKYLVPVEGENFHFTECSRCKGASDNNAKAEHSFSTEYKNDDDNHWRECECGAKTDVTPHDTTDDGDCTTAVVCSCGKEVVAKNAEHTPEEDDNDCTTAVKCKYCDEIAIEAKDNHTTEEDDHNCETELACTVCGTVVTEAKTHDFSGDWEKDAEGHYHVCQNEGCEVADTKVAHTSSEAATETEAEKCTVCNWEIAPIKNHEHVYDVPKYDEDYHWLECDGICGGKIDENSVKPHEAKADDGDCTTAVGCTGCLYEHVIPAKDNHDYTEKTKNHVKSAAKCTEDAVYYLECINCDAVATTDEYTYVDEGSATGHDFTEKTKNHVKSAAKCTEDAVYYLECTNCDAVANTDEYTYVDEGSATGHNVDGAETVPGKKPTTCVEIGWTDYKVCLNGCNTKIGYEEYTLRWPVGTVTPICRYCRLSHPFGHRCATL